MIVSKSWWIRAKHGVETVEYLRFFDLIPSSGLAEALRDTHYPGARKFGHGTGYIYPHDDPRGFETQYLPDELNDKQYYRPRESGEEREDD